MLNELRSEFKGINKRLTVVFFAIALLLLIFLPGTAKGTGFAAVVALFVALVAYPWQKERDRMLKVSEEKRAAYQAFFEAAELFYAKLRTAAFNTSVDLPDEEFSNLEAAKSELAFHGGRDGVKACAALSQHLKDYRKSVKLCRDKSATDATKQARDIAYEKVNEARVTAITRAREDAGVFDGNTSASEEDIRRLFLLPPLQKN
ncbi:MAG TPA: hypothetical protein PLI13_08685 [Paracoccus sp. (in: a-proteobacteria)]|nr:hypothetical protein [Paracoccus sp. (in: a-proteobacteria)]